MQDGLERRGYKEVGFLREVEEMVGTGIQNLHIFIHLAEIAVFHHEFPLPLISRLL